MSAECGKEAVSMMYWPMREEPLPVCVDHKAWADKVAGAMGLHLTIVPAASGLTCTQEVKEEVHE